MTHTMTQRQKLCPHHFTLNATRTYVVCLLCDKRRHPIRRRQHQGRQTKEKADTWR